MALSTLIAGLMSKDKKKKQDSMPPLLGPEGTPIRKTADITALRRKYNQAMADEDYETADSLAAQIEKWKE